LVNYWPVGPLFNLLLNANDPLDVAPKTFCKTSVNMPDAKEMQVDFDEDEEDDEAVRFCRDAPQG
jgi:hypothetical protein